MLEGKPFEEQRAGVDTISTAEAECILRQMVRDAERRAPIEEAAERVRIKRRLRRERQRTEYAGKGPDPEGGV